MDAPGYNPDSALVPDQNSETPAHSPLRESGRRLLLKFRDLKNPELERIEFRADAQTKPSYWQAGDNQNPLTWREVPQALSVIFLGYLCENPDCPSPHFFKGTRTGSLAGSLGDAVSTTNHRLWDLFGRKGSLVLVKAIFDGKNLHGKDKNREREIKVRPDALPRDCIDIYIGAATKPVSDYKTIRQLAENLCRTLKLPLDVLPPRIEAKTVPEVPSASVSKVGSKGKSKAPVKKILPEITRTDPRDRSPDVPTRPAESPAPPPSPPITVHVQVPPVVVNPTPVVVNTGGSEEAIENGITKGFAAGISALAKLCKELLPERTQPAKSSKPDEHPPTTTTPSGPQKSKEESAPLKRPIPTFQPVQKIATDLFQIKNPDGISWNESDPLLNFGDAKSTEDIWTIRDSCEGVLILGAVGSGKTSGSGSHIAKAFLLAGYGGLVLTAKTDEARRWLRLCEKMGRLDDCIHVTPQSGHGLNPFSYASQRPGAGFALTHNLISSFRLFVSVLSRHGKYKDAEFWKHASDQMLRHMITIFLLADEPLTPERFKHFVRDAPHEPSGRWREFPYFGTLLGRAEQRAVAGSEEDKRVFQEALYYWTEDFPRSTPVTRSGIEMTVSAVADSLGERGVHQLISTGTNVTPEMMLSGKIIILDVSLKENLEGGRMVQSAWKLAFQQAVERRADKGQANARPCFMWEDEGHLFFTDHDSEFQTTARDCRVARVILSQNLHNFHQHGHTEHEVMSVFSAMNLTILHSNPDSMTNEWAARRIGTSKKLEVKSKGIVRPFKGKDMTFGPGGFSIGDPRSGGLTTSEIKDWDFPPEDFEKLKKGGDGTCSAVVLWVSHQFAINKGKHYCIKTFRQD